MVKTCCVYKCSNQFDRSKKVSFFRFPKDKRKRRAWIKAVNRDGWIPNDSSWICSEHFIDGWHGYDPDDENYAPTIFKYKMVKQSHTGISRETRKLSQDESKESQHLKDQEEAKKKVSLDMHRGYCKPFTEPAAESDFQEEDDTDHNVLVDTGVQCDDDPLLLENRRLQEEIRLLQEEVHKHKWGVNKIKDSDTLTRFYTGLPTFAVFLWLYHYLSSKSSRLTYWRGDVNTPTKDRMRISVPILPPIDQLLAVLMRLRLGLFVQDLADRFIISSSTFSSYFTTRISLLHAELKFLNPFPSSDIINRTMPSCFKEKYPSTRVILDCTEIYIQRSCSLVNQSLTFSNYKHHNTLKFLVGISPSGVITFISEAWGGRVSDRKLTEDSGILDLLEPFDSVMTDKGFTIGDLLDKRQCSLNIPPFRGNSNQFSTTEVFQTQEIAQLRIHVERSIGRVKNFHILEGVLPLSLAPLASKIVQVCCWLTNFDTPLVEDKS